ncbi:MAG: hypothetical protein N2651_06840 [Fimbriimonadales bacterium]|nr:hypothetical protein [Fimbriimonadales bacterium]
MPNATVKAVLAFSPATVIAQSTTDSDGRYTLSIPADYIGRDLLIIAEKTVNNQLVRVSALLPALPPQGYAGANLDAYTTLATEEILRYARSQNLTALSPNGVATVVDRVREAVRNRDTLSLVVGQTLPQTIGEGLLDEPLRDQVRQRVEEQAQNLRPATGDVATAKQITQMLRDYSATWLDRGTGEALRLERTVREQEQILEQQIVQPLEAFTGRGLDFVIRLLGLEEPGGSDPHDSLNGLPPGRYREVLRNGRYELEPNGNAPDNRTWYVESGAFACTVTTANALSEFALSPEAGRVSFALRKDGDPSVQHDGVFEVTQRDAQNRATQLRVQFRLSDSGLRQPIQFNGTANTTPREDGSFRTVSLTGTLQSQFADLNVTNLVYDTYPVSERVKQVSAVRVQATLKSDQSLTLDLQNLNIAFADADPSDKNITQITIQSLTFGDTRTTLVLRDFNAQFQRVGGEPQPVRLQANAEYRTPNDTLVGTVNMRWQNPTPGNPLERDVIPLNEFPIGNFDFNGNLTPRIGRRALVYFNILSEPNFSTPRMRIQLRLELSDARLEGNLTGNLRIEDGCVDPDNMFQTATMLMTHTPSNFRVELSYEQDAVAGAIKKPDNAVVAQIGKASALGLPDLGNAYIVRYSDNTFETVNSLIRSED